MIKLRVTYSKKLLREVFFFRILCKVFELIRSDGSQEITNFSIAGCSKNPERFARKY